MNFKIFLILLGILPCYLSSQGSYSDPPGLKEAKKSYSQKKYDTAIKQFTAYSESNPGDGVPYLFMGYIYETRKDFSKSISMFKRAVDNNLSSDQKKTTLLKLSLYFNYYQDWDQAYIYSSRYLSMNSSNLEIGKIRDRAEANRGRPLIRQQISESQQHLTEVSGSKKSKQDYEEILKKNPKDEEALWELALIAFNDKKFDLAEKLMLPLVHNYPNKPSYSYKLGVTQIRLEKYSESIDNFNKSKSHVVDNDKKFFYYLYFNEGLALFKLNRFKESELALKKAYELNPVIPPLALLTKLYYNTGKYDECILKADQAILKNPNDLENKMYKVLCKNESKEKDSGEFFTFEKELRSQYPIVSKIPNSYYPVLLKLARDYTNSEKYREAEEYYRLLEKEYSKDREYLFYRGKALYYSGQPEQAIHFLERVERSTASVYLIAKAYSKLGNRQKTEEKLTIAGNSKAIYWDLALEEEDFAEMRKDPVFVLFLKSKKESSILPIAPNPAE